MTAATAAKCPTPPVPINNERGSPKDRRRFSRSCGQVTHSPDRLLRGRHLIVAQVKVQNYSVSKQALPPSQQGINTQVDYVDSR